MAFLNFSGSCVASAVEEVMHPICNPSMVPAGGASYQQGNVDGDASLSSA